MTHWHRYFCLLLFISVLATPVLAANRVATITLGRDPEPPFCVADPGGTVRIFWDIQHTTTPDYVDYKLQDPTRTINIEHQVYDGDTGLIVSRNWTVPPGSPDGKYWVRIEYHSYEAGNEADAEVTFYVCEESGTIIAHKYQDSNCNGVLDGNDQPLQDWWICIETPGRDRVCRRTDANGQASWVGIPTGHYRVYELPQSGWTAAGPDTYDVDVTSNGQVSVDFLNYRYQDCFGACCFPDGSCTQVRPDQCDAAGGFFHGLGTVCDPNPCPQPEACCFHDGHCEVLIADLCRQQGGTPQGPGTVCDPNPCPQPTGACCFHDGHCAILTEAECAAQGGAWQGIDMPCLPNPCTQPMGACCFPDGHCTVITQAECTVQGGTWRGIDTTCDPNPCTQPSVACCFPDGHCEYVTAEVCVGMGGVPQGYGSVCDPNPCPQPPVACCFTDGHCEYVAAEICRGLGGIPQGLGSVCEPNPCPQQNGACCFSDGHCAVLTAAECQTQGGTYQGDGTNCSPNLCPQPPTGACCIGDQGDCRILTHQECNAQNGRYQGDGTTCEPTNPCNVTPTKTTTWGKIKATYR